MAFEKALKKMISTGSLTIQKTDDAARKERSPRNLLLKTLSGSRLSFRRSLSQGSETSVNLSVNSTFDSEGSKSSNSVAGVGSPASTTKKKKRSISKALKKGLSLKSLVKNKNKKTEKATESKSNAEVLVLTDENRLDDLNQLFPTKTEEDEAKNLPLPPSMAEDTTEEEKDEPEESEEEEEPDKAEKDEVQEAKNLPLPPSMAEDTTEEEKDAPQESEEEEEPDKVEKEEEEEETKEEKTVRFDEPDADIVMEAESTTPPAPSRKKSSLLRTITVLFLLGGITALSLTQVPSIQKMFVKEVEVEVVQKPKFFGRFLGNQK